MLPVEWISAAAERIAPHIRRTPLTHDADHDLYLKWENRQVTGSFKPRGALNKVLSLQPWEQARGLVAASAGNHGQGVALAASLVQARALIFCSEQAVPAKVAAMQALGAEVRQVPGGYSAAEQAGLEHARLSGMTWVSPYNDGQVIAGQGTLALEMLSELPPRVESASWIVPAGGGGLISGIGAVLHSQPGRHRLVGVQSEASPFCHALFHSGRQDHVSELPSLADGLAGAVEEGSLTIPLLRRLVDDFVLVSEAEIVAAIVYAWQRYGEVIEGSAATALAAALTGRVAARPAVVVITGGNIQAEVHGAIVSR
jgi:threonine dehydratase